MRRKAILNLNATMLSLIGASLIAAVYVSPQAPVWFALIAPLPIFAAITGFTAILPSTGRNQSHITSTWFNQADPA
jgi:hypothetical protein